MNELIGIIALCVGLVLLSMLGILAFVWVLAKLFEIFGKNM